MAHVYTYVKLDEHHGKDEADAEENAEQRNTAEMGAEVWPDVGKRYTQR
jgi:hypothetical protein